MIKYTCDRCGSNPKLQDTTELLLKDFVTSIYYCPPLPKHLCLQCTQKLHKFLRMEKFEDETDIHIDCDKHMD